MAWSDIPGWFGFSALYDRAVAEAKDGESVVEVGVAFGRSIAYLARRVIDSGKRIRIYAVDTWSTETANRATWRAGGDDGPPGWGGEHAEFARALGGPFNAFCHCMHTHAPEELERIQVMRCESSAARVKNLGPHRMVFIDGDHSYESVAEDIACWRSELEHDGILGGDDYSPEFPGVQRAVREAFGPGQYKVMGTTWWRKIQWDRSR